MQIAKASAADMDRFRSIVPDDPRVVVKPMFGNLGAFVNGNMFMGLYGADVGVKLPPGSADALRAVEGAGRFGPPGSPMGGYVVLPPASIGTPEGDRWIALALEHVGALPPKAPKAPKTPKR